MRKNLLKKILPSLTIVLMLVAGVSCSDKEDGSAQLKFSLTDAPSMEYSAVNIDVRGIEVGVSDADSVKWVALDLIQPNVYNLLDYRNGKTVLLADASFPAGKISQVRLILGTNNTVVKNGVSYPLKTPSGQQSGVKFNLHQTLEADMSYNFVIDFDASRSIVEKGNAEFLLKPVIRTFAEAYGATLRGYALPADAKAYVEIIQGTDTLMSIPEADGKFLFAGIKGGIWKVNVIATDELNAYKDSTFSTASIVEGKVTDLGNIVLKK